MMPAANGQAYRAYLESALSLLDVLTAVDYYASSIPSSTDQALGEIVNAFTAWTSKVRGEFIDSLPAEKRGLFGVFGHRAATIAVRKGDPEWLRLGLIGNVIANTPVPPNRNLEAALVVYYHCARKLEIDPQALFDDAAQYASGDLVERLEVFGRRSDLSLKSYGWREIKTPDGIRFKFEW